MPGRLDHRAAFEASAVPTMVVDLIGVAVDVNDAYLALSRRTREDVLGAGTVRFLHPDDKADVIAASTLLSPERRRVVNRRRHRRGDGTVVAVQVATTLLPTDDLLLVEVVEWEDLDEEPASADSTELGSSLLTATSDGVVLHDGEGRMVKILPVTAGLLGRDIDAVLGCRLSDAAFAAVRPDGRPVGPADDPVLAALAAGAGDPATIGILLPDGGRRWLSVKVEVVSGGHVAAVSFLRDVSTVVELEEERRRLAAIAERSADFIAAWDGVERLRWVNRAGRDALGLGDDLVGTALGDLLAPSAVDRWANEVRPGLDATGRWAGELDLHTADGRILPVDISVVADDGPPPVGASAVAHDLTERIRLERELAHRASHDPLTGLANRTLLLAVLDEELARGRPVAVAFVDLDGFKAVNDRHGHAAGDRVLVEVAARLVDLAPPGALVARAGGDEFVVIVATESEAVAYAAALASGLGDHGVRASVGVAVAAPSSAGERAGELLARADAAMYEAKRARTAR